MYNSKLAVALKTNGRVLREFEDTVYVPFGSEYSVFVKNMNSVRALVSVEIDGEDVGDGRQFVINAHDGVDLERFLKNDNLYEGNRFKFIERTENVENHRGIGVEDGLIRVEFQFEKQYTPPVWNSNTFYTNSGGGTFTSSGPTFNSNVRSASVNNSAEVYAAPAAAGSVAPENDVGVTVPGSISDQRFHSVAAFPVEAETHVIVLKMLGQTEQNVQVRKPITVKSKPTCTSCGLRNKATAKFCTECGTSLQLV